MAKTKKAKKTTGRKRVKQQPAVESLNKKQSDYVTGIAEGKSKMQAALDAGYSESSAKNAAAIIEGPDVRRAFQELIRKAAPMEKVALRISEGLDATDTKFATFEGKITDRKSLVAWESRLQYAKLAAEYGGYHVPKQELEVTSKDVHQRSDDELRFFVTHGIWPEQASAMSGVGRA